VVAEYFLREIIAKRKDSLNKEIKITSAGIELTPKNIQLLAAHGKCWDKLVFGLSPYPYAIESMRRRGIDISKSRSKELTKSMVEEADLIIVFEDSQNEKICSQYPQVKDKIFTLQELVGYDGYLVITDYSFPGAISNPETKAFIFPDSFLEGSITDIQHMLWWGINRILDAMLKINK
jgi:protein-tyrosine-phosphatase